jgi:hypothetical protein
MLLVWAVLRRGSQSVGGISLQAERTFGAFDLKSAETTPKFYY